MERAVAAMSLSSLPGPSAAAPAAAVAPPGLALLVLASCLSLEAPPPRLSSLNQLSSGCSSSADSLSSASRNQPIIKQSLGFASCVFQRKLFYRKCIPPSVCKPSEHTQVCK